MSGECARESRIPIRIAGLDAVICTRFAANVGFFEGYRIDEAREGAPVIGFTAEQLEAGRRALSGKSGGLSSTAPDAAIERILLHEGLSEYAVTRDVLLMHGSALRMDGEGYLFAAASGTGKSTHARLWREAFGARVTMVNDDKPFLICGEHDIYACGTPWNGKHGLGENTRVRLRAIAFLERGETNLVVPMVREEALSCLYTRVYRPRTEEGQRRAVRLIARICRNVALYRLRCNMERDAALVAYEGMR